jgi:hypothetical protein
MEITNKHGLPETFLTFARDGKYDKGNADISVTTLIDAPRVAILKKQKKDELTVDVVDMIWPLFGTAVHHMLESTEQKAGVTMEERLFINVDGWTLSGQIDHQEESGGRIFISDYKVTSVWSVIYGKDDWVRQLNCYAQMVRMAKGVEVGGIRIVAVLRDWQRREAKIKPDYPQTPVVTIQLPLWPEAEAMAYIRGRVSLHQTAQKDWDEKEHVVECSDEERWTKPDTFAVTKRGLKRAHRVFDSIGEAKAELDRVGKGYDMIKRPGGRTRCEQYCSVADFCTQWAMEQAAKAAPELFGDN